jgi:hypothetical protein
MTKRWSETQHLTARWFASHGWPHAEAVGNGRRGVDVTGTPGLAIEVKATAGLKPGALAQAANGRSGLPFVVYRPPGSGPANMPDWPVTVRLDDFTALLKEAGYGDPGPCPGCGSLLAYSHNEGCPNVI